MLSLRSISRGADRYGDLIRGGAPKIQFESSSKRSRPKLAEEKKTERADIILIELANHEGSRESSGHEP